MNGSDMSQTPDKKRISLTLDQETFDQWNQYAFKHHGLTVQRLIMFCLDSYIHANPEAKYIFWDRVKVLSNLTTQAVPKVPKECQTIRFPAGNSTTMVKI